jgi:hypothetical protein
MTTAIDHAKEVAALKAKVAELEYWIKRQQRQISRLSYFHDRLKADKGLMPTKVFMRIVNALHSDRRASVTSEELDAALQFFLEYRPHIEVKPTAAARPRAATRGGPARPQAPPLPRTIEEWDRSRRRR